jgi:dihydroxyacid dehydratase/phosphogluconate dehydratase
VLGDLHLSALAYEPGYEIGLQDFNWLGKSATQLAIASNGPYVVLDLHAAGAFRQ